MTARPFISSRIHELEQQFDARRCDKAYLDSLLAELKHRKTKRAQDLKQRAVQALSVLPKSPSQPKQLTPLKREQELSPPSRPIPVPDPPAKQEPSKPKPSRAAPSVQRSVTTVREAPAAATGTQNPFAVSDANHVSSPASLEPTTSIVGAEKRDDPKPAAVLALENPAPTLDQPEVTEREAAPKAIDLDHGDSTVATSGDDLTVIKLGLAVDEPHKDLPSKEQTTYAYHNRPISLDRPTSQNAPEEELLLDLAVRSFASTRLVNVLRNAERDLPAKTVAAYMRAPDAAREAFRQLENFGEKTATELDDLVRKFTRKVDQDRQDAADNIVDVVRDADCSVRLLNAISAHSHRLPVTTVSEYMKAPEHAHQAFLKLRNLGRKSADELDLIMRSFVQGNSDLQRALTAAEEFFSGMIYPDELFEWSPPTRLTNLLKIDQVKHRQRLVDFLKTYDETASRIRSLPGCGRKSIEQLDAIVGEMIEARLSFYGVRSEIAPDLRRLLNGEFVSHTSLKSIVELGDIKPEDIKASEFASVEELTVTEIIEGCISTLDDRQQDILQRRYGINRGQTETLEQVASDYDVTRERIRQIEKKAKQKLETKRIKKILIGALEQEGSLEKLFKNRKIVSDEQLSAVINLLTAQERIVSHLMV